MRVYSEFWRVEMGRKESGSVAFVVLNVFMTKSISVLVNDGVTAK